MNKHLEKMITYSKGFWREWVRLHKELPDKKKYGLILVEILVLIGFFWLVLGGKNVLVTPTPTTRKVTVESLAMLSNNEKDLPLIGTVTSVNEATIRSESSGRLNRVYKKLGDQVYAGQIIAEFENSGERASLLQAEGAYEQAKAARDITRLSSTQSGNSLQDTKNQALNAIYGAYTTLDDSVRGKTDIAFSDARFDGAKLTLSVPDAQLVYSLETRRKSIEQILLAREARNKTLTTSNDLVTELTTVQNEVQMVKTYLDDLSAAYSKALQNGTLTQSTIDAGKTTTQIARQAVLGSLSTVVATRTTLSSSITAKEIAGSINSDAAGSLATADAQVKQAQGAYNAALSRLQKTIVRSPITGTINSLSVDTGDYVGSFSQIAVISNNGALEIISYVTDDDAKRITVGSTAKINGAIDGIVTRIASAIDPVTKKIEVRIGIKEVPSTLINGQSVRLSVGKDKVKSISTKSTSTGPLLIPLSSLKLTPQGANVFTVSASSTLVAISVKEGAILGDQIQILQGLVGDETIVVDARGLKEGMQVVIAENK